MSYRYILAVVMLMAISGNAQAQLLKKLKDKVNQAADQLVSPSSSSSSSSSGNTSNNYQGKPSNKGGGGLVSTPPDIEANIQSSETAFKESKYSESRFALQQAILGVELKIGQEILKGLPEQVSGMTRIPEKDQCGSSGWGWSGLVVRRSYQQGDKYLEVGIQDLSILGPMWSMYMNSEYAMQQNNEQKAKNIMVKGNKGMISYDDSKGYTVVVMLTQGSALGWEGVNIGSEQEMMNAVNQFDIDKIKKYLGEK